jgi:hypothetical protein
MDKEEARSFVASVILDLPQSKIKFTHRSFGAKFNDWFASIDIDGSGTLDFEEIYEFVLQALGL